jgi:uncharacterized protein YbjT (DUF2867 family)
VILAAQHGRTQLTLGSIGATGHIGGAVLEKVTRAFPTIKITALLRDQEKADRLQSQYPNVKTLIGDLQSTDVVKNAAKEADIVISKATNDNERRNILKDK